MIKQNKETKRIISRVYVLYGLFIVNVLAGVYAIFYPSVIPYCLVLLSFLIYNIFTTLYNLILTTTKIIIGGK
jgi:heme A synthase